MRFTQIARRVTVADSVDVFDIGDVVPVPSRRCKDCPTILRKTNHGDRCSVCEKRSRKKIPPPHRAAPVKSRGCESTPDNSQREAV